jgi:hypothetical protein
LAQEWQILLDELRESQFSDLARLIEEHIAAGKSVPVEERKRRGQRSVFEPVQKFDAIGESEEKRPATHYDLQVIPYTEREREQIALAAIREQFAAPKALLSEIHDTLPGLKVAFASPVESTERVSFEQYAEFLNTDQMVDLKRALDTHESPA